MYRVHIGDNAGGEIAALPAEGATALAEAITVLEVAPWSGQSQNRNNPEGAVRRLLFGPAGSGQVVYLVLDHAREVHVLVVVWIGA